MSEPKTEQTSIDESGNQAPQGTQELTVFVQNLLQQMQTRFQEMSDTIIARIDEMGARIDDLEQSIGELMAQAGIPEDEQHGQQKEAKDQE